MTRPFPDADRIGRILDRAKRRADGRKTKPDPERKPDMNDDPERLERLARAVARANRDSDRRDA